MRSPSLIRIAFLGWQAGALMACNGQIGEGSNSTPASVLPPASSPGTRGPESLPDLRNVEQAPDDSTCDSSAQRAVGFTPLRRLTRGQYDHTVRDLFGLGDSFASAFPVDDKAGPFPSNAVAPVSDAHVRKYADAAEAIAALAVKPETLSKLAPCDPTSGDVTCAEAFIRQVGRRAFRAPLDEDQVARLRAVYQAGSADDGFVGGIQLVVEAMLQAPRFLYQVEAVPAVPSPQDELIALSPFEQGARLSYFLWGSLPDEELLTAAEGNHLGTADELRAQAERMLRDPRAADALAEFVRNWLAIDTVDVIDRSATLYPGFVPGAAAAMKAETVHFVDEVVRKGDGLLTSLMTAPYSYLEDASFPLYGMTKPSGYDSSSPMDLPKGQRAGILTQPSVLAMQAHTDHTSPVKRGIFVLKNILCHELHPPEGLTIPPLPDPDPSKTTRQRFAQHTSVPACASCHTIIDPIGFSFERYDSIGAYREKEGQNPIDDTGDLHLGDDKIDGPVAGALDLVTKLTKSVELRSCMTKQWTRFALQRVEVDADACTLASLRNDFAKSGYNVRELMLSVVSKDSFRFAPAPK